MPRAWQRPWSNSTGDESPRRLPSLSLPQLIGHRLVRQSRAFDSGLPDESTIKFGWPITGFARAGFRPLLQERRSRFMAAYFGRKVTTLLSLGPSGARPDSRTGDKC